MDTFNGHFTVKSSIYEFNVDTKKFEFFQSIETKSCLDIEHFKFGRDHYLIYTNHYDENLESGRDHSRGFLDI